MKPGPEPSGTADEPRGNTVDEPLGVPPDHLDDGDLLREIESLARTREDTLRHGSDSALAQHDRRTRELEEEYKRRFPGREIDPERLRDGARRR